MAAMVGAILIFQAPFLHPPEGPEGLTSPLWVPTHFGLYVGFLLVQLGLIGILARQLKAAGLLGVLGFVVAFLGVGLTPMEGRDHTFSLPILRLGGLQTADPDQLPGLWELILNAAVFSLGHILLGVAIVRAAALPRVAGVLLAVGAPLLAFSPPTGIIAVAIVGATLYAVAMAWIGWSLIRSPETV